MNTGSNRNLILPENNKIYVDDLILKLSIETKSAELHWAVWYLTKNCDDNKDRSLMMLMVMILWSSSPLCAQWVTQVSPGKVKHVTLQVAPPPRPLCPLLFSVYFTSPHSRLARFYTKKNGMVVDGCCLIWGPKSTDDFIEEYLKSVFFVSSCQSVAGQDG